MKREEHWLSKIENLKPGHRCEFQFPARLGWNTGVVEKNGGSWYWVVRDESGQLQHGLYIEHIRLPGQTEAWPR